MSLEEASLWFSYSEISFNLISSFFEVYALIGEMIFRLTKETLLDNYRNNIQRKILILFLEIFASEVAFCNNRENREYLRKFECKSPLLLQYLSLLKFVEIHVCMLNDSKSIEIITQWRWNLFFVKSKIITLK